MSSIQQLLDEGDLYSAQMKMKATLFRLKRKKEYPNEAKKIFEFLKLLFDKDNYNSGIIELLQTYIDHIPEMLAKVIAIQNKPFIIQLLNSIPYSKEKYKVFMTFNKNYFDNSLTEIVSVLCEESVNAQDYKVFQQTLMLIKNVDQAQLIQLFQIYALNLKQSEKNLAFMRYILYLMINKKMKRAHDSYLCFCSIDYFEQSEEKKLMKNLFLSAKLENSKIFEALQKRFERTISRDPTIKKMITKVGGLYCGVKDQSEFDIMSMMQGFLSG